MDLFRALRRATTRYSFSGKTTTFSSSSSSMAAASSIHPGYLAGFQMLMYYESSHLAFPSLSPHSFLYCKYWFCAPIFSFGYSSRLFGWFSYADLYWFSASIFSLHLQTTTILRNQKGICEIKLLQFCEIKLLQFLVCIFNFQATTIVLENFSLYLLLPFYS